MSLLSPPWTPRWARMVNNRCVLITEEGGAQSSRSGRPAPPRGCTRPLGRRRGANASAKAVTALDDTIAGNRLEKLSGDREGQHSIRINDQWRICFRWRDGNAYDVEVTDYHRG